MLAVFTFLERSLDPVLIGLTLSRHSKLRWAMTKMTSNTSVAMKMRQYSNYSNGLGDCCHILKKADAMGNMALLAGYDGLKFHPYDLLASCEARICMANRTFFGK